MFIESDNQKIESLLRKLLCIYSRSLKKIIQKYFLKYYNIVTYLNYLDSIKHLRSKSVIKGNNKNLDLIYSPYQLDGITNFLLTPKKEDSNNVAYLMTPCYIIEDNDNNSYNINDGLFPFSTTKNLLPNTPRYNYNTPNLSYKRFNTTSGNNTYDNFNYYEPNKFKKTFSLRKNKPNKNKMRNNRQFYLNNDFYNNDILDNLTDYRNFPKTTRNKKTGFKNNFDNNGLDQKLSSYLCDNNFRNFMLNDLHNLKQKISSNYNSKIEQNKKDYQKRLQFLNNGNKNNKNPSYSLTQKKTSENNLLGKSNNVNNLTTQIITSFPNNEINDTNPLTNYTVSSWDILYTNAQGKSKDLNISSKNKFNYNNNTNNSNTASHGFKNTSTNYSNCQNSQLGFISKDQFKKNNNELSGNRKKPCTLKISNAVNEYYNDSFSRKNSNNSSIMNNISKMTMQSISDSKILEIANRYAIGTEEPYDEYQMANIIYNKRKNNKKKHDNKKFRY